MKNIINAKVKVTQRSISLIKEMDSQYTRGHQSL